MRESNQEPLAQRVLHFIREHRLLSGRQHLVVAVSGGPDSVCLLRILAELRSELGISLHVAHLDHQLRGADSEADARYVFALSQQLGIPASIEQRDVKAYQTQQRLSPEEAAREVRYAFLAQVAQSVGADRVAVGHTVDDNVETILMHLVRGTGSRGLRGLQPDSQLQSVGESLAVIRPLLTVSREETAEYCRCHRLMPRFDASNLSMSPLRNRIRHQLLPLLENYNPRVVEALLRTARIAADDLAFIDEVVGRLWDEVARKQKNAVILDKRRFLELPAALKRHLLRASVEKLLGDLKDIEARHIEEIMDALDKPAGKRLGLPGGLVFSVEYHWYLLGPDPAALFPFPIFSGEFPLNLPGETLLPGWLVEATVINREQAVEQEGDFTACFDLAKTGDKLLVRSRQRGDRFQPLGMSQPKKLGQYMIDAKIPQSWRQRIPVVCSPDRILWVVGWRIDDCARITAKTGQVLCLKFRRN